MSRKEAAAFIRSYLDSYPGVENYMETIKETATRAGVCNDAVRPPPPNINSNFNVSPRPPSGSR